MNWMIDNGVALAVALIGFWVIVWFVRSVLKSPNGQWKWEK